MGVCPRSYRECLTCYCRTDVPPDAVSCWGCGAWGEEGAGPPSHHHHPLVYPATAAPIGSPLWLTPPPKHAFLVLLQDTFRALEQEFAERLFHKAPLSPLECATVLLPGGCTCKYCELLLRQIRDLHCRLPPPTGVPDVLLPSPPSTRGTHPYTHRTRYTPRTPCTPHTLHAPYTLTHPHNTHTLQPIQTPRTSHGPSHPTNLTCPTHHTNFPHFASHTL